MKIILNRNKIYMEFFYLYINSLILVDTIRRVNIAFPIMSESNVSNLRNTIYITIFIYVFWDSINKKRILFLFLPIMIYFVLVVVSLCLEYSILSIVLSQEGILFILRCIPGFYFGITVLEEIQDLQGMKKYYILMMIYIVINLTYIKTDNDSGYMTFAYNILFPLCFLLFENIIKQCLWKSFGIIVAVLSILLMGARGPLAVLIITSLIGLFYFLKKSRKKNLLIGMLGSVIVFVTTFFDELVNYFYQIFPYSRTIFMLKKGMFFSMSGRDDFYTKIKLSLQNDFIAAHGIYSDRIFLSNGYQKNHIGMYAHNLIYEWLYQYGGLCGAVLCLFFFILIIISWRKLKKANNNVFAVMYISFSAGITMLLFSNSYLSNERFWVAFGIIVCLVKGNNKTNRNIRNRFTSYA